MKYAANAIAWAQAPRSGLGQREKLALWAIGEACSSGAAIMSLRELATFVCVGLQSTAYTALEVLAQYGIISISDPYHKTGLIVGGVLRFERDGDARCLVAFAGATNDDVANVRMNHGIDWPLVRGPLVDPLQVQQHYLRPPSAIAARTHA